MKAPQPWPQLSLEINGNALPTRILRCLFKVRIQQRLSLPTLCELGFLDVDGQLGGSGLADLGCHLRISLPNASCPLFDGEVTGIDYVYQSTRGKELRIKSYDVLNRLARRQTVRAFSQATLEDIVRELTADLGIAVTVHIPDKPWERVIQHAQTDLELLAELSGRRGAYFYLRDAELHIATLQGTGPSSTLRLGNNLLEAQFQRNQVSAPAAVTATGWNAQLAGAHTATAANARIPEGSLTGGVGNLTDADFNATLVNQPVRSDGEAEDAAQAELDRCAARELRFSGVSHGDPELQPGTAVTIPGVEDSLVGPYALTAVNHLITAESGFVSELDTLPPAAAARSAGVSVTLGVVTRTDDPQKLGRVQLSLPAFGKVDTDWVQTVSPWAGAKKGFMSQADVDDRVLFLFFAADLTQGIVLGSVYGDGGPPGDWSNTTAGQCYTLITPGGQKLRLDDARGLIRLETQPGSYLELSPKRVTLHSSTELHIEAPGQPVVIRGNKIDFERA